jgi:hypothetical protein
LVIAKSLKSQAAPINSHLCGFHAVSAHACLQVATFPSASQQPELQINICTECLTLRKGWPLIESCEAFSASYNSSHGMRQLVEAGRDRLRKPEEGLPHFMLPGKVRAGKRIGSQLQVKYGVYTQDEFLAKFSCGPQSVKAGAQVINLPQNQELKPETVVIVPGDLAAPRVLKYYVDLSCELEEDMLGKQLHEGHAVDKMQWLCDRDLEGRPPPVREAMRQKLISAEGIAMEAEKVQQERKKAQVLAALQRAGVVEDGKETLEPATRINASPLPSWLASAPLPAVPKKKVKKADGVQGRAAQQPEQAADGADARSARASNKGVLAVASTATTPLAKRRRGSAASTVAGGAASVVCAIGGEPGNFTVQDLLRGIGDKRAVNGVAWGIKISITSYFTSQPSSPHLLFCLHFVCAVAWHHKGWSPIVATRFPLELEALASN